MITSKVDVGTAPEGFEDWATKNLRWTTTVVCFHGFADLITTRGESVISPEFSCFGHRWQLYIYPGGEVDSDEGDIAIELENVTPNTTLNIQYGYSVRDSNGKEVAQHQSETNEFSTLISYSSWITSSFARRSTIMDALVKGSLVIEVRMKPTSNLSTYQLVPTNPINKNVLKKFMHEETADVVFEVNNNGSLESEEHTNKKSKTTTTFYAHRFILQGISTMLSELCKPDEGGGITTISITDVKPKIFKHMIYYAYGGKLSDEDLKDNAKDIINACDKYGVVHLKLEAEAWYVKSIEITMDNIMDNLLYADSKNLALLKETAMDYIVANKKRIMGKVSFSNVPGAMMMDLLAAVARGEDTEDDDSDDEEDESIKYTKMRVGTLRNMLLEKGLDVDGSREAMIALLKENNDSNGDDNGEDDNDVEPVDA